MNSSVSKTLEAYLGMATDHLDDICTKEKPLISQGLLDLTGLCRNWKWRRGRDSHAAKEPNKTCHILLISNENKQLLR